MFEIRERVTSVSDAVFRTYERDAREGKAAFEVLAGTTGLCGNEATSESVALIQAINVSAGCGIRVLKDPDEGHAIGFTAITFGDDGILALLKALKFALKVLEDEVHGIDD